MHQEPNTSRAVVLHIADDPQDMERAVRTARAVQERFPGLRIRIIVNGPALGAVPSLTPQELPADVEVAVCALGLQRHNIAAVDVPDGVEVVPMAPVAILEEQFGGATYLRL